MTTAATTGSGSASAFDPFFRTSPSAGSTLNVTPLDLTVRGIREDLASGRGSAIITTPDGTEKSVSVGEEIIPGVVLKLVEPESVTITRDGLEETIFLQQD